MTVAGPTATFRNVRYSVVIRGVVDWSCTVAETVLLASPRLCQSRSGFTQPTTFMQPLKDADDLCKGPRRQWRARIVCLPVLHGPLVGRDQLIFADSGSDDLRYSSVTNWANDRNN